MNGVLKTKTMINSNHLLYYLIQVNNMVKKVRNRYSNTFKSTFIDFY